MGGDIGEHEELAPCMAPAERLRHRSGLPVGQIKPVVAGIGIGLQNTGELPQVPLGMIARTVARAITRDDVRVKLAARLSLASSWGDS